MNLLSVPSGLPAWRCAAKKPALPMRVAHLDLKGPKIPLPVFRGLLRLYGRWGLNGVLVEYEHRLPAMPLPRQFPAADRYTRGQIRGLTALAGDLGIEWIPLVQMFGHKEYLGRLPGTRRLIENPDSPGQLCPSRPAVRDYLRRLADLVCDFHPQSRYFHAGMDETHSLGHCPACRARAATLGGPMELYLDHAAWVCGEIRRRGRVPMMWGDMFLGRGRVDLLDRLGDDVIVMPWDYTTVSDRAPGVFFKGARLCRSAFRLRYDGADLARQQPALPAPGGFAEDLSKADLKRVGGLDPRSGTVPGFTQLRVLAGTAKRRWCIGAAQISADGLFHPNYIRGLLNGNQLVRDLLRVRGEGGVMTVWARGHSLAPINAPWPLALYALAQFAASAWSGRTSARDLASRKAAIAKELGMPARFGVWTLDDLLGMLSRPAAGGAAARAVTVDRVRDLVKGCEGRGLFGESLVRVLEVESLQLHTQFLLEEVRWWLPNAGDLPAAIPAEMRRRFRKLQAQVRRIAPAVRRWYVRGVGERAAFDLWWTGIWRATVPGVRHGLALLADARRRGARKT